MSSSPVDLISVFVIALSVAAVLSVLTQLLSDGKPRDNQGRFKEEQSTASGIAALVLIGILLFLVSDGFLTTLPEIGLTADYYSALVLAIGIIGVLAGILTMIQNRG